MNRRRNQEYRLFDAASMRRKHPFARMRSALHRAHNLSHVADRHGTATVEFALVAPLFLTLVVGLVEMSRAIDVSVNMNAALREGGRLATMDYADKIPVNKTTNAKVIQDIRNMLSAGGMPGEDFEISVTHAGGNQDGQPFDFDDPDNYLLYFRISASIPYEDVGMLTGRIMSSRKMDASMVYRMGRTSLTD